MARRLIGTGTTNAQGIATCNTTYTGVGAGKLQIIAVSGNLESDTYELLDAQFYDDGVTTDGGKLYYTNTTSEVSRTTDSTGTLVTNLTDSLKTIRANKPSTTADEKDWDDPLRIEFDIMSISGELSCQLWKSNDTGDYVGLNIASNMGTATSAHIRIEYDGSRIKLYVDNTEKINSSFTFVSSDLFGIRLLLGAGASFKYKNFLVYPI